MTKFEEEFKSLFEEHYGSYVGITSELVNKISEKFADWQPQQALPVVPEFVDKFLQSKPIFNIVKYPIPIEIITWANKQTGYMDLEIYITYLIKLKTNGYTVEKPQLFYLKNKLTKSYLYYDEATKLYSDIVGNVEDFYGTKVKFTQHEIDRMETGSYERIEVVE